MKWEKCSNPNKIPATFEEFQAEEAQEHTYGSKNVKNGVFGWTLSATLDGESGIFYWLNQKGLISRRVRKLSS